MAALPDGEDNDDRCVADVAGEGDYDDDDDDEDEVNLRADNPIWQLHLQEYQMRSRKHSKWEN